MVAWLVKPQYSEKVRHRLYCKYIIEYSTVVCSCRVLSRWLMFGDSSADDSERRWCVLFVGTAQYTCPLPISPSLIQSLSGVLLHSCSCILDREKDLDCVSDYKLTWDDFSKSFLTQINPHLFRICFLPSTFESGILPNCGLTHPHYGR